MSRRRRPPGPMDNLLQISIIAFFLLVVRFGFSFIDIHADLGEIELSVSLVGFVAAVIVGLVYAAHRRWEFKITTDVAVVAGAVLISLAPPASAPYLLVTNFLIIGWCMHSTGRFW